MLEITRTEEPKGLRIEGDVDLSTVEKFRMALAPMVHDGGDIVLDVSDMQFIDSSGAQVLIGALEDLDDRGRLLLVRPRRMVVRMVKVMGLERFENLEVREDGST
jgi:anti-sigma B factor antagonist